MIKGIDVSRWQGEIDWKQVAGAGYLFAAMRATIGDYYTDPTFTTNFDGAKAAGIVPFPYHVLRTDIKENRQTSYFLNALDGRKVWMVVLDVEVVASGDRGRRMFYVMRDIENETHAMTTIYTNANFWNTYMPPSFGGRQFKDSVLFVASYGRNDGNVPGDPYPTLPRLWNTYGIWQYTDRGRVPGINANVDLDLMEDELYFNLRMRSGIAVPGGSEPPPEPPPPPPEPPSPGLTGRVRALEEWAGSYQEE